MSSLQKLSGFAKHFRSALLTRWRGFLTLLTSNTHIPLWAVQIETKAESGRNLMNVAGGDSWVMNEMVHNFLDVYLVTLRLRVNTKWSLFLFWLIRWKYLARYFSHKDAKCHKQFTFLLLNRSLKVATWLLMIILVRFLHRQGYIS